MQLLIDSVDCGPRLCGAVLEYQFCLRDGRHVLFLTADCPYEETLHIHLLSSTFERLDGLELGAMYCSGRLRDVRVLEGGDVTPDVIEFDFIHSARCRIRVLHRPQLVLFPRWTCGVRRSGPWFRQYLEFETAS